jgi:hypothetical protein
MPLPACIGNAFPYNQFGLIVVLKMHPKGTKGLKSGTTAITNSNTNQRALEQGRVM